MSLSPFPAAAAGLCSTWRCARWRLPSNTVSGLAGCEAGCGGSRLGDRTTACLQRVLPLRPTVAHCGVSICLVPCRAVHHGVPAARTGRGAAVGGAPVAAAAGDGLGGLAHRRRRAAHRPPPRGRLPAAPSGGAAAGSLPRLAGGGGCQGRGAAGRGALSQAQRPQQVGHATPHAFFCSTLLVLLAPNPALASLACCRLAVALSAFRANAQEAAARREQARLADAWYLQVRAAAEQAGDAGCKMFLSLHCGSPLLPLPHPILFPHSHPCRGCKPVALQPWRRRRSAGSSLSASWRPWRTPPSRLRCRTPSLAGARRWR